MHHKIFFQFFKRNYFINQKIFLGFKPGVWDTKWFRMNNGADEPTKASEHVDEKFHFFEMSRNDFKNQRGVRLTVTKIFHFDFHELNR